jgi:O-antigen/teichoic acid export membrane protein
MSRYAGNRGNPEERAHVFREQSLFSLRVTFNQLLAMLNYQIDVFIVLFVLGHAWLGRYSIAVGIGAMMWQLSRPLTATSYGSVTSGTPEEAARVTVLCVRHALFSVGLASVVLAVIGPWLLQLVYGPAFAPSGRALQLLLPGVIAYCAVPFFGQYFTLQLGKPGLNTIVIGTSTVLCAIVTLDLVHRFGILAGAIGTSVSYTVAFLICAIVFCRKTRTPFSALFAFSAADFDHYVLLVRWIVSGLRATYARRAG